MPRFKRSRKYPCIHSHLGVNLFYWNINKKWARSKIDRRMNRYFRHNPVYYIGICTIRERRREMERERVRESASEREYFAHIRHIHVMYSAKHQLCKLAHKLNDQWPIKITLHRLIFTNRKGQHILMHTRTHAILI